MLQLERGDVAYDVDEFPPEHQWKATEEGVLRQFVEIIAKDRNEHVDTYMLRYEAAILDHLRRLGVRPDSRDRRGAGSSDSAIGAELLDPSG
jgi:hypothetical protein